MAKKDKRYDRQVRYKSLEITDGMTFREIKEFQVPDDACIDFETNRNNEIDCIYLRWNVLETEVEYAIRMVQLEKEIKKEEERKIKNAEIDKKRKATLAKNEKIKAEAEIEKFKLKYPELFK